MNSSVSTHNAMSATYGYRKHEEDDIVPETAEELHTRAPEYKGYTQEQLELVVTLLHKNTEPEKQTIKYCIDNGFVVVEPNVWAGSWHRSHPDYIRMMEQIPESLRRFVNSQQQRAAVAQVANIGSGGVGGSSGDGRENSSAAAASARFLNTETESDLTVSSDVSHSEGMDVCGTDEAISIREALDDLHRAVEILEKANSSDEPWQHPRELLDATAGALDEAALAVRADRLPDVGAVAEIKDLSEQVKKARQTLIDASVNSAGDSTAIQEYAKKIKDRNSTPLIVWATQTGTSRKFASELRKKLAGSDGKSSVDSINMKELSLKDVASRKRVYFITSTFGLGRPPRDAEFFFATLQLQQHAFDQNRDTSLRPLDGVQIAVAALGNSKFGDFASFGFALAQELQSLGARDVMPVFPVNALNGRVKQRADFRQWQEEVLELEGKTASSRSGEGSLTSPGHKDASGNSCCIIL